MPGPPIPDARSVSLACSSRRQSRINGSIVRDLDEVLVGVADIDRLDRADRPGARSGTRDDRHAASFEMRGHVVERDLGDEAEIARAGRRLIGNETRYVVGGMKVDLLPPLAR